MELLFLVKGEMQYEFKEHETVSLRSGTFLIIPPLVVHRAVNGVEEPSSRLGILCRERPDVTYSSLTKADSKRLFCSLLPHAAFETKPYDDGIHRDILQLFEEIECNGFPDYDEDTKKEESGCLLREVETSVKLSARKRLEIRSTLNDLIVRMAILLSLPPLSRENKVAKAAVQWLEAHQREPFDFDALLHHLGYGKTFLFACFKKYTGMTPNDWLLRCRIRSAKRLLEETRLPVTGIGLETGFSSSQHFSQVFKKYIGKSPCAYRESLRG